MKKFIFILAFIFAAYINNLYAQYNLTEPVSVWSAKSWATFGVYKSDTDYLNSTDIFEIQKSLISLEYSPLDTNGNIFSKNNPSILQGYGGVAIGSKIYLGLSVAYDATINDKNIVTGETRTTSRNILFFLRPVLRINEMFSIEYMYDRAGTSTVDEYKGTRTYTDNRMSKHRIAMSVNFKDVGVLTIPISISSLTTTDRDRTMVGINPEFFYKMQAGVLKGINFKINAAIDAKHAYKNNFEGKKPFGIDFGFGISPSIYAVFADDVVFLGTKPEVGAMVNFINNSIAKDASLIVSPYLTIPIGTLIKLGKHFEFRFGFEYSIAYNYIQMKDKVENTISSDINVNFGFGINITENAYIDFMLRLISQERKIFALNTFALQATYRF